MSAGASPSDRLKSLDQLLKKGVSFEEAVERINPSLTVTRDLLRRLAFVRQFDRPLYDIVAARVKNADSSMFDAVVGTPGVEPVTPLANDDDGVRVYRIKDGLAADLLNEWLTREGQTAVKEVAGDVWQHLVTTSRGTPLQRLRYQIAKADASNATEQSGVLEAFNAAFARADDTLDLAECHALVRMLHDLDNFVVGNVTVPLRLLSSELKSRCDELEPYIAVRGRFIQEYAKSTRYQQRSALWSAVQPFLHEDGQWLLSLFGTGGRGKTIFLNWLIARYCVSPPRSIPVGRVDFDEINVAKFETLPELLLLPLAEQLHRQVPALQDVLERWGHFSVILTPITRIPRGVNIKGLEDQAGSGGRLAELVETFVLKLSSTRQVVLLLDTLEEAMLHHPKALQKVIELCRQLRRIQEKTNVRTLRVVLSGRYNLRERGFLTDTDPAPVEIQPFNYDERVQYLRETRGWKAKGEHLDLVEAIAQKAGGNPFILSLVADLVEDGSVHSLEDVRELKPEFAYLIDRVIKRIPEAQRGVRWVIRYGVVPYRLTQDFLVRVMTPHLRRELEATEGDKDKVAQYAKYFPRGGQLDFGALWTDLSNYASDYGWVNATAEEIRFQPEVVVPMTALLSTEEVFEPLHRDARDYFRQKAEREPSRWASWMGEAVFHSAHLRDPALETTLRTLLADPRALPAEARRDLLDAVTRSSFVDDEGNPRLGRVQEPIVPATLIGLAYLELARLGAGVGFGPCRLIETESSILSWLDRGVRLYGTPSPRLDIVIRMAIAGSNSRFAEVLHLAEGLPDVTLEPADRYAYLVLLSRASASNPDPVSLRTALAYLDDAERLLPHDDPARAKFLEEKGSLLARAEQYDAAVSVFEQTVVMSSAQDQTRSRSELAEHHFDAGEYARAIEVMPVSDIPDLQATREGRRLSRTWVLAQVEQRKVVPGLPQADAPDSPEMLEARGAVLVSTCQLATGIEFLEQAVHQYLGLGDVGASARAALRLVRARIDLSGDLNRAARFMPEFNALDAHIRPLLAIERAGLMREMHAGGSAEDGDPWTAAVSRLIAGAQGDEADECLKTLADAFERMQPIGRRYQSARCFKWIALLRTTMADRLLACFPSPEARDADYLARIFPLIGMLHALGEEREARKAIQRAYRTTKGLTHTAGRELVQAALVIGSDLPDRESLGEPQGELDVAIRVEYVHALLARDRTDDAAQWQAEIPADLPRELMRSLVEATHLDNQARLASVRSSRRAKDLHQRSQEVRRQLGQEQPETVSGRPAVTPPPPAPRPPVAAPPPPASVRSPAPPAPALPSTALPPSTVSRPQATPESWEFEPLPSPAPAPTSAVPPISPSVSPPEPIVAITVSLAALADPAKAPPSQDIVPFEQVKLLIEPEDEVVRRMAAVFPTVPPDGDVRLVADGGSASLLPWEWAVHAPTLCYRAARVTQEPNALSDIFWPRLPEKVRRILVLARPLRVVVVQPGVAEQERRRRGFERVSRRTLVEIYKSHGLRAKLAAASNRDALIVLLAELPHIVHLQLPIVERYRQLRIAFGEDDGADLSVEALLAAWPAAATWRPLIILDPPRPSDDLETARQLLLRNGFATELFTTGRARGVLCTGLFEPASAELCAERLAHTMSSNPPVRSMLTLVQRELPGDRFATRGAALLIDNLKTALA